MATSAGLLIYRRGAGGLEVFLVHPGGPFWRKKDQGAWSIPKGVVTDGEDPFAAAQRELREETGFEVTGPFLALPSVRQVGGKVVKAWAVEAEVDPERIASNTFTMEWPPRSGRQQTFPEVDRAAWFTVAEARERINAGQVPLLEALEATIGSDQT